MLTVTSTAHAYDLTGVVVSVPDGDTISIQTADRTRHRIRLDGIDAPERTQSYSQVSRKSLLALVEGKVVTVTSGKTDRFDRMVGIVRTQQHSDVGLEKVKAGLAWHFKRYEGEQDNHGEEAQVRPCRWHGPDHSRLREFCPRL